MRKNFNTYTYEERLSRNMNGRVPGKDFKLDIGLANHPGLCELRREFSQCPSFIYKMRTVPRHWDKLVSLLDIAR